MNAICFPDMADDNMYNSAHYIGGLTSGGLADWVILVVNGNAVGYAIYQWDCDRLEVLRRGILPLYRRCGYGKIITYRLIETAAELDVQYYTYANIKNMASINSNISCGCRVLKIGKDYIELIA